MHKSIPTTRKAFFDTADDSDLSFWSQGNSELFAKATKTPEHAFYIRKYDAHPPWQNCTLFISGTYLVCKTVITNVLNLLNALRKETINWIILILKTGFTKSMS